MVDIAQNLFSTRRGSVIAGAIAAAIAGIVLFVYLHNYRNSIQGAATPASVLVARNLIQRGTPGDVIGSTHQFQVTSIPKNEIKTGAFADPSLLTGRVAAIDIYPGQQLTATDFAYAPPNSLQSKLLADERVINITTDSEHGLIGQISAGDHVDVFVGLNIKTASGAIPVIKLLMSDVPVLRVPLGTGGQLTLQVPETRAGQLAYAADNGKLWFVLRPASGAKTVNPGIISAQTLLAARPVH